MYEITTNALIFLGAGGVLLYTVGEFRKRMNALRAFCKKVEIGELGGVTNFTLDNASARPDDLTLLARSVDEMRTRLLELIGTDPLTGCLNRRAFDSRMRREWRSAKRRSGMLALLAIDIDQFKPINDTNGHAVGDLVLLELTEVMRQTARDTDAVARVGGDEFAILLPDTGWQGATTFGERLRRRVDEHKFITDTGITVPVTISIGVACFRGTDDVTPEDIQAEADRSLYRSKTGGRNRISA